MSSTTTLWNLLKHQNVVIPSIQRDYAQGREGKEYVRKAFLTQIKEHLDNNKKLNLDFVYGNNENSAFQPLDGQQRLTTLWLLHWYLAFRSSKLEEAKEILKKFTYETRVSSRDFCKEICEKMAQISPNSISESIGEYIRNQSWFFNEWKQDPTIDAMLRTISKGTKTEGDNIEAIFGDIDCSKAWSAITDGNLISFELMIIGNEKLPIADDLYIKMNARGKQLTDFENFKADLISYIQKEDTDNYLSYSSLIDNAWTDVFWESAKNDAGENFDGRIDDTFFMFINRFVLNQICLDDFTPSFYDSTKHEPKDDKEFTLQKHFNKLYGAKLGDKKGSRFSNDDSKITYEGFEIW